MEYNTKSRREYSRSRKTRHKAIQRKQIKRQAV